MILEIQTNIETSGKLFDEVVFHRESGRTPQVWMTDFIGRTLKPFGSDVVMEILSSIEQLYLSLW